MSVKKGTAVGQTGPEFTAEQWRAKGDELESNEDFEGAVEAFLNALKMDPADKVARYDAAQIWVFNLEMPQKAIDLIAKTPMNAMDSDFLYLRARALGELGKKEEAIGWYPRALQMIKPDEFPRNSRSEIHCSWALDLRDIGKKAEALPIAIRAAGLDPLYPHAWECLGYFQYLAGNVDVALQCLALGVALDSALADTLREDPDFGDFRHDPRFVKILKTEPLTPGARELLPTLWPKGSYADTLPAFLAAIKRHVRGVAPWKEAYLEAVALEETGSHEEAVAKYRASIELDPKEIHPRYRAARNLLLLQERPEDAVAIIDAAPDKLASPDFPFVRGRALADLGRPEEAQAAFREAIELARKGPSATPLPQMLCTLALQLRNGESRGFSEEAAVVDPLYAHAWECIGFFQFVDKDLDRACASLRVCVALDPEKKEGLAGDPDFGDFRQDPRFTAMLATAPLDSSKLWPLRQLFPSGGMPPREAIDAFLAAVAEQKILDAGGQ